MSIARFLAAAAAGREVRKCLRALAALAALALALPAIAQELYAVTWRGQAGAEETAGNLYTVDLTNGTHALVAPIRVPGGAALGLTGLAVHPRTGALYGITSSVSEHPLHLVRVDPATGSARVIGELGHAGSDIAFGPHARLYIWLHQRGQPGLVNLETGAVEPVGAPLRPQEPGGFAIDSRGEAYMVRNGAGGTLDTVDLASGVVRRGPSLQGASLPAINTLTFSISQLLVGSNSSPVPLYSSELVTINASSGQVAVIGSLPDGVDGIAFMRPTGKEGMDWTRSVLTPVFLGIIAALLALIAWDIRRSRRARKGV